MNRDYIDRYSSIRVKSMLSIIIAFFFPKNVLNIFDFYFFPVVNKFFQEFPHFRNKEFFFASQFYTNFSSGLKLDTKLYISYSKSPWPTGFTFFSSRTLPRKIPKQFDGGLARLYNPHNCWVLTSLARDSSAFCAHRGPQANDVATTWELYQTTLDKY